MCHIIKSSRNTHSRQHVTKGLQNIKPEYIPVGCLPSTAVAAEVGCIPACTGQGRVSAQGGCVAGGVCPGGVCPGGCLLKCMLGYTHPLWTEFLTHACENITFPQLRCGP